MTKTALNNEIPCLYDEQGVFWLEGEFTKESIPQQSGIILKEFAEKIPTVVELSHISKCDSALVALLIQYKQIYPHIIYRHPTEVLQRLLAIYEMRDLLFVNE